MRTTLNRIGIAIEKQLLRRFDRLISKRGYANRSEAFRDLIRNELVQEAATEPNQEVLGTVTIVYDHHTRLLSTKLNAFQHHHYENVISTLHVHLDHDNCLEAVVVRGTTRIVQELANELISTKGVKYGKLTILTTTTELHYA